MLNRNSTFISRLTKFLKVQNNNEFKSLISCFIELKKVVTMIPVDEPTNMSPPIYLKTTSN